MGANASHEEAASSQVEFDFDIKITPEFAKVFFNLDSQSEESPTKTATANARQVDELEAVVAKHELRIKELIKRNEELESSKAVHENETLAPPDHMAVLHKKINDLAEAREAEVERTLASEAALQEDLKIRTEQVDRRHFRAPQQALRCSSELRAVSECYSTNMKDPLSCRDLVTQLVKCSNESARQAVEVADG